MRNVSAISCRELVKLDEMMMMIISALFRSILVARFNSAS